MLTAPRLAEGASSFGSRARRPIPPVTEVRSWASAVIGVGWLHDRVLDVIVAEHATAAAWPQCQGLRAQAAGRRLREAPAPITAGDVTTGLLGEVLMVSRWDIGDDNRARARVAHDGSCGAGGVGRTP